MISRKRLLEVLSYDPTTGDFTWLVQHKRAAIGAKAGHVTAEGYRRLKIDGKLYLQHRLAFLYMTGCWPKNQVDHVDGDVTNNSWNNLREATRTQNLWNMKVRAAHLKGAYPAENGKWKSSIAFNKKQIYLGRFDSESEAHAAYILKARELFGVFARAS